MTKKKPIWSKKTTEKEPPLTTIDHYVPINDMENTNNTN